VSFCATQATPHHSHLKKGTLAMWQHNNIQRTNRMPILFLISLTLLGFGYLLPNDAQAATPRIIRPGTRPYVYMGGIGAGFSINNGFGTATGQFTLHNTLGFHFSGESHGPALGGDLDLMISGDFAFVVGPRFWWDIPINNMGVYVSPFVRMGFAMFIPGNVGGLIPARAAFNLKFGARGKVILNNKISLFIELPGFNMFFVPTSVGLFVAVEYQFLLGAGITF
jgi:hypothetical protein